MRYRWFSEEHRKRKAPGLPHSDVGQEPQEKPKKGLFSSGEKASLVLFTAMLCWGMSNGDLPIVFFCLAFIVYELRPLAGVLGPGVGTALSNMMQGFSLALVAGALAWLFL